LGAQTYARYSVVHEERSDRGRQRGRAAQSRLGRAPSTGRPVRPSSDRQETPCALAGMPRRRSRQSRGGASKRCERVASWIEGPLRYSVGDASECGVATSSASTPSRRPRPGLLTDAGGILGGLNAVLQRRPGGKVLVPCRFLSDNRRVLPTCRPCAHYNRSYCYGCIVLAVS
jgi:hypothetical protein